MAQPVVYTSNNNNNNSNNNTNHHHHSHIEDMMAMYSNGTTKSNGINVNKMIKNGIIDNNSSSNDENESLPYTPSPSPSSFDTNLNNIYDEYDYYDNDYNNYMNNNSTNNNNNDLIKLSLIYGYLKKCMMINNEKTDDDLIMDDDFDDDIDIDIDIKYILSSNITQLILLYFDDNKFKDNKQNGSFLWRLPTLELLTAKCIDSIPFQIGSFLWYLSIYPYGIDDEHINFTNLYINLSSKNNIIFDKKLGISISEIIINARLYCYETKSCWSSIKVFKSDNDYHGWQKGALKINELCKYKYLTFIVYINILRINNNGSSPLYQYPLNISNKNKFTIKWKIDKLLMNDLRIANEMKRFESNICYNMWVLGCVPNGIKKDNESSVFKIYLKLCALPPNISKIKVKFNILCVETKKHLKYIYNDFDYKHKYWQTDKLCKRSYLIFNDFNTLRFKTEIEIIEQYDLNHNELSSNIWKKHIKNNNINKLITSYISLLSNKKLLLLINGFIRKYYHFSYINNKIDKIISIFYPKINGDLFTWNISCQQIIKLSQLNYKQRFDSKIFNISSLKWFLQIYPNGYRPEDEGFCSVYLILAYLPSILKEITIHFGIYCPQTMSNFSTIHTFNHSRDGRGTRRMLSLSHLKKIFINNLFNKFITFNCYINILKIKIKDKQIIYQYPLSLNNNNFNDYIYSKFKWQIDKEMMMKFKQCNNGQRFESAIFNEMWNLSCFPNENKKNNKNNKDDKNNNNNNNNKDKDEQQQNVVIGIRLCALPKDIIRIKVKYKLLCVEFERDNLIPNSWTHSANFDYDNYYVKFPKHTIQSNIINQYHQLTFNAEIQIIQLYDLNGKIINKFNNNNKNTNNNIV